MTLCGIMAIIPCSLPKLVALGASYVKVVDARSILSATEMSLRESSFRQCMVYANICQSVEIQSPSSLSSLSHSHLLSFLPSVLYFRLI